MGERELINFVRLNAWLDAQQYGKDGKKIQPRRYFYKEEIPPAGPLGYLYYYLVEAGPLTEWQEIQSWSKLTGTHLEAWEAIIMHKISVAYTNQLIKSSDTDCSCPIEKTPENKDISDGLKKAMLGLNK